MKLFVWHDRREPSVPRVMLQQGRCNDGQCGQYSVSISNGEIGMTVRFESEAEFRAFLERGESAMECSDKSEPSTAVPIEYDSSHR